MGRESLKGRTEWLGVGVGALVLLSLWLGQIRIFQVDEVQWAYTSRILGTHGWSQASATAPLWLLGPLSWWARHCQTSAGILQGDRLMFTGVFWLNLALLVKACGFRLRSQAGAWALLAAATLEPLWDYGLEIRHDNLLLTGILGLWLLFQPQGKPLRGSYAVAGAIAAIMQFCAFKAFLYWVPLAGLALAWPHPKHGKGRLLLLMMWVGGLLAGVALCLGAHLACGTLGLLLGDTAGSAHAAVQVDRFSPWLAIGRLFSQTPLLLGSVTAFSAWLISRWKSGDFRRDPWSQGAPEGALLMIATLVLLANPTPFPYNLVLWVPFAFMAALKLRAPLAASLGPRPEPLRWVAAGLAAAHLAPWIALTPRHWDYTNERQIQLMSAAEGLTGPQDAVFDGAGLVATRPPFAEHWLLHTLTIQHFLDGSFPSISASLAARPTPVILPNYRTTWIRDADTQFINAHYVALAPDFMLLGHIAAGGKSEWEALADGRYLITVQNQREASDDLMVDGVKTDTGVRVLSKGAHTFAFPPQARLQIVWVGPTADAPPALGDAPNPLFVNWY